MWARTAETAGRVRSTRRRFQARLAAPPLWVFRPAPIGSACGDAPRLCPLTHRAREWWPLRSTRLRLPGSASPRSACRSDRVHHRRTCRWSRRGSPGSPSRGRSAKVVFCFGGSRPFAESAHFTYTGAPVPRGARRSSFPARSLDEHFGTIWDDLGRSEATQVPVWVPLWIPGSPKWLLRVPKLESRGLKNNSLRYLKVTISAVHQSAIAC